MIDTRSERAIRTRTLVLVGIGLLLMGSWNVREPVLVLVSLLLLTSLIPLRRRITSRIEGVVSAPLGVRWRVAEYLDAFGAFPGRVPLEGSPITRRTASTVAGP